MRQAIRNTARAAVRAAASMRSLLPEGKGSRIITYHSVRPVGPGRRSAYVSPADMQAQLTWLAREYEVVPLSTIMRALEQGRPLPASWVSITFDDGYMDNYQYAYPILRGLNLPATIFVVTGKIGRDPAFLTLAQIAEMRAGNITEQILGEPVQHFCYPHGHFNPTIESFVREAGFHSCCTEKSGAVSNQADGQTQTYRTTFVIKPSFAAWLWFKYVTAWKQQLRELPVARKAYQALKAMRRGGR